MSPNAVEWNHNTHRGFMKNQKALLAKIALMGLFIICCVNCGGMKAAGNDDTRNFLTGAAAMLRDADPQPNQTPDQLMNALNVIDAILEQLKNLDPNQLPEDLKDLREELLAQIKIEITLIEFLLAQQ